MNSSDNTINTSPSGSLKGLTTSRNLRGILFIAGPCVIESMECLETDAQELVRINNLLGTDIIFKASFDKANRTSLSSYRGPGLEKGLQMLASIKEKYGLLDKFVIIFGNCFFDSRYLCVDCFFVCFFHLVAGICD